MFVDAGKAVSNWQNSSRMKSSVPYNACGSGTNQIAQAMNVLTTSTMGRKSMPQLSFLTEPILVERIARNRCIRSRAPVSSADHAARHANLPSRLFDSGCDRDPSRAGATATDQAFHRCAVTGSRPPARSEALTLLEVLQREGRLIDFLKEPIAGYADAQIGAAVRDIHRDCGAAIDRLFGIKPLRTESDGAMIEMPEHFDAAQYRLIGNVTGQQPYRGTLRHAGWQATCLQLPSWNGSSTAAHVIAPAEVEI
jgi:hypothetical protein